MRPIDRGARRSRPSSTRLDHAAPVGRAIEEIVEWLAAALTIRGGGLVCFYY
jgi:hypothetical protein